MKDFLKKLESVHWTRKLFYFLTLILYFSCYGLFVSSLLHLEGIEDFIRYLIIGFFAFYGLLFLIFGSKKLFSKKRFGFVFLILFSILFSILFGVASFSIDRIYQKIENFTTKETSTYTSVILSKKDTIFTNESVIGMVTDETDRTGYLLPMEWIKKDNIKNEIEYCMKKPINIQALAYVIKNITKLILINRGISPLTKLPGNIPIQAELKKRLLKKQEFAVLYFDLDNFKAYNDTYGFLGGDEIIKQTAKIIVKNINSDENSHNFVGHIGGDDFVGLVYGNNYEEICQNIILEFDTKILDYFSEEDREKGYLEVPNRKGIIEEFPLVSISVGIVVVSKGRFHNILEIGEVGAQVKHMAKVTPGSAYSINRRAPN